MLPQAANRSLEKMIRWERDSQVDIDVCRQVIDIQCSRLLHVVIVNCWHRIFSEAYFHKGQ